MLLNTSHELYLPSGDTEFTQQNVGENDNDARKEEEGPLTRPQDCEVKYKL